MKLTSSFILKVGFLIIILMTVLALIYDQLFSKPVVHQGIILEKIEVPRNSAGPHVVPYSGSKSFKYIITSEKYHQWIALVRADDGDTLKVHCSSDHFLAKGVGDTILFKEYKGSLLKVDYLSHSEEDTVDTDWNKVFHHQ